MLALLFGFTAAVVGVAGGCSGGTAGVDDGDAGAGGGDDARATGDGSGGGGDDGAASDGGGGGGEGSASQGAYCTALADFDTRCHHDSACDQATLAQCSSYEAVFSTALVDATAACAPTAPCTVDAGAPNNCILDRVAAAPRTSAQQKLAADFCASCTFPADAGTTGCESDFYKAGDGGKNAGAGFFATLVNDDVVNAIDSSCATNTPADAGPLGCAARFEFCAITIIQQREPQKPAACNDN